MVLLLLRMYSMYIYDSHRSLSLCYIASTAFLAVLCHDVGGDSIRVTLGAVVLRMATMNVSPHPNGADCQESGGDHEPPLSLTERKGTPLLLLLLAASCASKPRPS